MYEKYGIMFKNDSFPLRVDPERESGIDSLEGARQALHEAIEIKYFYEGTTTLLIGRRSVNASAGDIIVINPYEFHATVNFGEKKGRYHLILVSIDLFAEFVDDIRDLKHRMLTGKLTFPTKPACSPRIKEIMTLVAAEAKKNERYSSLALRGLVYELIALLLREAEEMSVPGTTENSKRNYALVEPALRRIRDGYRERMTVEELAALCSVSKYHFCRVFKAVTGVTVMQYLNDYRLNIADTMLKNTDKSVSEVAWLSGFADESYFCRLYKRRFGTSTGKRKGDKSK